MVSDAYTIAWATRYLCRELVTFPYSADFLVCIIAKVFAMDDPDPHYR